MHDLDRVQLERNWAGPEDQEEGLPMDEFDEEFEEGYEEGYFPPENEFEVDGFAGEGVDVYAEMLDPETGDLDGMEEVEHGEDDEEGMEDELAAELLASETDEDLERAIHRAMRYGPRSSRWCRHRPHPRRRRPPSRGRHGAVRHVLKGIAKKTLPAVGGAVGSVLLPGAGGVAGRALGRAAGRAFGLEMEGMSPEDQQFEVAKRVVRLAGESADAADRIPETVPDHSAAKQAVASAARVHAPGLLGWRSAPRGRPGRGGFPSGRWIRHGNRIVLLGV